MKDKFTFKLTALFLALLLGALFALASCGKGKGADETSDTTNETVDTDTGAQTKETEADTDPMDSESLPDENERVPVSNPQAEAMVKHYFDLAMQVYDWLYESHMPVSEDAYAEEDGAKYYPVIGMSETPILDGGSIETYDDLCDYIYELFDGDIARILVSKSDGCYRDINGRLHCRIDSEDVENSEDGNGESDVENGDGEPADTEDTVTERYFVSLVSKDAVRYTLEQKRERAGEEPETVYIDYIFSNTSGGWCWTVFPLD